MDRRRSFVRLSKLLSLMLRHRPEEFGIEVDRYGFADLEAVLTALQGRDADFDLRDIEAVVYDAEKQRFEIVEGRIRARYGHSFPVEMDIDPTEPPPYLYKGVDADEVDVALAEGLKPSDRQYVHLSFDPDVAAQLGGRRGERGAVIRVDALRAHQGGVPFYDCGPTVLTPVVPPDYVALESLPEVPPPPGDRPPATQPASAQGVETPQPQGPVIYGRRRKFSDRR